MFEIEKWSILTNVQTKNRISKYIDYYFLQENDYITYNIRKNDNFYLILYY